MVPSRSDRPTSTASSPSPPRSPRSPAHRPGSPGRSTRCASGRWLAARRRCALACTDASPGWSRASPPTSVSTRDAEPTVVDLAGRGTGAVTGATWVTSDAPIADSVGLTRSTVGFDRHTVTGGLNAALYYEQENVASGYSATPKPTKQAARVMLVAAVVSSAGQPAIAVLDHGVSADGTLARITTDVVLTDLAPPQTAGASPNALLDQLASARIRALRPRRPSERPHVGGQRPRDDRRPAQRPLGRGDHTGVVHR